MRVAVIGAGVAGLACASELASAGHAVVVLESSRSVGGRAATRRTEAGAFDDGCPLLARGSWLLELAPLGLELACFAERETPVPSMETLCAALGAGLDVRAGVRVARIARAARGTAVRIESGDGIDLGAFDRVAVTAPAPRSAELLADGEPDLAERAGRVLYAPCWTALAAWDERLALDFDWHREAAGATPVAWACRESAKPGREPGERWTVQAGPLWSRARLGDDGDVVARDLVAALGLLGHEPLPPPALLLAHRWRFAQCVEPLREPCLVSEDLRIGAAGDWCAPPPAPGDPGALQEGLGVPAALHAGRALARALIA